MTTTETAAQTQAYSDVRDLLDTAARYSKEKAEKRAVGDMEGVVALQSRWPNASPMAAILARTQQPSTSTGSLGTPEGSRKSVMSR